MYAGLEAALTGALRFRAVHKGETVFYGLVDELSASADEMGCTALLRELRQRHGL